MAVSDEVRKLKKKWLTQTAWPKRLQWVELHGLRGWTGQRIEFGFPLMAVVGENGSGKSTILQAAASVHRGKSKKTTKFPSEFFPVTAWDLVQNIVIKYGFRQGSQNPEGSLRRPGPRWLGHDERPEREVRYIDLRRTQPVSARVGYAKIAKTKHKEASATEFEPRQLERLSAVMGKEYIGARMALSDVDTKRTIPVIMRGKMTFSGFHQGSGETTVMELLQQDMPKYGIVLIDEIESSLHPRAQRRLVRDLAEICREQELQIIMTTHSPFILEELPLEARLHIMDAGNTKSIVPGVSPQFAMTNMDDFPHPEGDLYVEDLAAKTMLAELLAAHAPDAFMRTAIIPYGGASVGMALGQMVAGEKFPRPTLVFIDGDNAEASGCILLPGGDAPERVVFGAMRKRSWGDVWRRISRDVSLVGDACNQAMTLPEHHSWVTQAATLLRCSGENLWTALCAEWAQKLSPEDVKPITDAIEEILP